MYLPTMGNRSKDVESEAVPDGTWERNGKNPVTAALFGLSLIGVTYYYAQAVMTLVGTLFSMGSSGIDTSELSYIEKLSAMISVSKQPLRISLIVSQILFMLLPTLWLTKKWHSTEVRKYLRIAPAPFMDILLAVVITLLFVPSSHYISNFLLIQLHMPDFFIAINEQLFASYTLQEFLWLTLVVCITPAVCEEVFFRGYVQRTMERRSGPKSFIIIGIVFGLFHVQPINLLSLTLLGMLFGYFYQRSRSIMPNAAAHFTNNFAATVLMVKAADGTPMFGTFISEMGIVGVLITIPPLILLLRYYHFRTERLHQH
jgi:membrane protease YdiL (CAAX protease family)